jgi:hypothetical protein
MRIEGFHRRPNGWHDQLFDDLPPDVHWRAQWWLNKFIQRHQYRLASERWLYPILIGQARRLALNPPTPAWGRRMLSKLGGLRVQQLYRNQNRTGSKHPAHKAARISANLRRLRKEEKLREAMGLPPKTRHKQLPLY